MKGDPTEFLQRCTTRTFRYTTLFSIHGDVMFADRAERIAFNALPATFASPRGGDLWAHQHDQSVNEVMAVFEKGHIWDDGPNAEMYALHDKDGCCTANFNQASEQCAAKLQ